MRFEMKNLTSFPMEKLCFDLKLEALEQIEPGDVLELAKVNQGFQGMLVRDPSIVFGDHVHKIEFHEGIWIGEFSILDEREPNVDRPFSHFSFVKKIRSCDRLSIWNSHRFNQKYRFLNNLKLVNQLLMICQSKEELERFVSNFHASIKKEAHLYIGYSDFDDPVIKDRTENFMVGPQLKDCEQISVNCLTEDSIRFCYNALLKTEIKNVAMLSARGVDWLIQQIITNGIPNKNPEAAILASQIFDFTMDLSQYPGMRGIDGENRLRLLKLANYIVGNFVNSYYASAFSMEKSSVFRRHLDSTKDCIYVYDETKPNRVLAFHAPID